MTAPAGGGDVVDLFAGAGGWDVGARALGLDPLGIEWDDAACETRAAAGLRTAKADVASLKPIVYAPVRGVIASPPCPTLSMAGHGAGRAVLRELAQAMRDAWEGATLEGHREFIEAKLLSFAFAKPRPPKDPAAWAAEQAFMSLLICEPARWVRELRPEWVACEQVEPGLGLWRVFAELLRGAGYSVWCGVLSSERYGVPQTRRRAILMASRTRRVAPPEPTHQEYVAGVPARREEGLFGSLEPWVSMAEALGWGMTERPTHTVTGGGTSSGGGVEVFGSSHVRAAMEHEREHGAWRLRNGNQANACERAADEPAGTMFFGHKLNDVAWYLTKPEDHPERVAKGAGNRPRAGSEPYARPTDAPAPTVDAAAGGWQVVDTGNTRGGTREEGRERSGDEPAVAITSRADQLERRLRVTNDRPNATERSAAEPAQTMAFGHNAPQWVGERPATTVAGDPRVHPPGHKENGDDPPGVYEQQRGANAVRVTVEEAAVLQGFPSDYPWRGTRTKQFEQVGNTVPPPLARAVIAELAA